MNEESTKNSESDHKKKDLHVEFLRIAKQTKEDFQQGLTGCKHPGELGIAREKILIKFLERFIPDPFEIGTGFVIDAEGNKSKQIDVIIFDKTKSRGIGLKGGLMYYPCESVVAVGEVKTTIQSKEKFKESLDKIESVQKLKCHSILRKRKMGFLPKELRILSFVFTSKALAKKTMYNELNEYCSSRPRSLWPNFIVDFEKYLIFYHSGHVLVGPTPFPHRAESWCATTESECDKIILLFACYLVTQLSATKKQDTLDLLDYFGVRETMVNMLGPIPKYTGF